MRQAVTLAPHRLELRDAPPPEPAPGEALVRVEAIGLCGSDFHIYDGSHPYARFPQVQGHEVVGTVAALPEGYGGALRIGDRVAVEPLESCGECFACRRGRPNCCPSIRVLGVQMPGGLTEQLAVPPRRLVPTGDLPAQVAVLTEPVSIGLHAVARAGVAAGDDVVVVGAGPIGLAAALAAADRGARVLVADRIVPRLRLAGTLGAARVVDTGAEDLAEAVADFTGGQGAATVVEATGVPALVRQSVDLAAHSGTIVIVGISTAEVGIPVSEFSRKELNVLGSRNSSGEFAAAADLVRRYAEPLAALVTHRFGLEETAHAMEYARTHPREVGKAVVLTAAADRP